MRLLKTATLFSLFVSSLCVPFTTPVFAGDTKVEATENTPIHWLTDAEQAKALSRESGKSVLMFFTGSDWCGVCKVLEKKVLYTDDFVKSVEQNYVPLMLDYPRSFSLSEELTTQNAALKQQYKIEGYPTVILADAELLPYGAVLGFRDVKFFNEGFLPLQKIDSAYKAALAGKQISNVNDLKTLDESLRAIPTSILLSGWIPTVERTISIATSESPELSRYWSGQIAEAHLLAEDKVFRSASAQELRAMAEKDATDAEMLAVLESLIEKANGREARLEFLVPMKFERLSRAKEYQKVIDEADQLLKREWAHATLPQSIHTQRTLALLHLDRIDEGLASSRMTLGSDASESDVEMNKGNLLLRAGMMSLAAQTFRKTMSMMEKNSKEHIEATRMYLLSTIESGQVPASLGDDMMYMASCRETDATVNAANAAMCYRILGQKEKADEALKLWETDPAQGSLNPYGFPRGQYEEKPATEKTAQAAKSSVAECYLQLSQQSRSIGKVIYLMHAVEALQSAGDVEKAAEVSEKAKKEFERFARATTDKQALETAKGLVESSKKQTI